MYRSINGTYLTALAAIVLVHGYSEGPEVWDSWEEWLSNDNLTGLPIKFDDMCGTVEDHARELEEFMDKIDGPVNMVVHSKGGLDARAYIAENPGRVLNLIMIGTPNQGTSAALMDVTSCAYLGSVGLHDMLPGNVKISDSINTTYWAVAGNYSVPCIFVMDFTCLMLPSDGFVTVESAKSNYTAFEFPYSHNELIQKKDVYNKVLQIID